MSDWNKVLMGGAFFFDVGGMIFLRYDRAMSPDFYKIMDMVEARIQAKKKGEA